MSIKSHFIWWGAKIVGGALSALTVGLAIDFFPLLGLAFGAMVGFLIGVLMDLPFIIYGFDKGR